MSTSDRPLSGTVAIVTGASRGLGRAFAVDLAAEGAAVTLVARSAGDLAETASMVTAHGVACEVVVGDVCDGALAEHTVTLTEERLGPVRLLVNNAGVAHVCAVSDAEPDDWWRVVTVNLRAPFVWTKAVLPGMQRRRRGRIINVSSPAMTAPLPYYSSYGASKAGLSQFTACFAEEVAADGVGVYAIGPAALTDMTRATWENDVAPAEMREAFRKVFTSDPEGLLDLSVSLFRFVARGGADHVSGSYVGARPGDFDTPDAVAARPRSPAGEVLLATTTDE
jgi:NAD(P)-dependent dehydrogenase (short-subunit alcohol dehydrogenase family)